MSDDGATPAGFKPKKSVALSGVVAGNTTICTVGRTGNDLQYRGYDILDIAESCEFEEIAYRSSTRSCRTPPSSPPTSAA
jgi:2-methylcitrate synthase